MSGASAPSKATHRHHAFAANALRRPSPPDRRRPERVARYFFDQLGHRERVPAEHVGGHRGGHGHFVPPAGPADRLRGSPGAAPRMAESNPAGSSRDQRTVPACGRPRSLPPHGGAEQSAETHVLPTSVPVPTTRTRRRAHCLRELGEHRVAQRGQRGTSFATCSSVWAADTVTRSRLVPTGTVGRADGRHPKTVGQQRGAPSMARCSLPTITGMMGLEGVAGPATRTRAARSESRCTSASPSLERSTPSAANAAAASAGVRPVVKM